MPLSTRVKTLQLQLAERDAIVRVLKCQHTSSLTSSLSRTSSISSLLNASSSSPSHTPVPSSSVGTACAAPPAAASGGDGTPAPQAIVSVPHTPQLQHREVSQLISHTKSSKNILNLYVTSDTSQELSIPNFLTLLGGRHQYYMKARPL